MQRASSLEKTLMQGKTEGQRRGRQQKARWLGNLANSVDRNLNKLQETVEDRGTWCTTVHWVTERQS